MDIVRFRSGLGNQMFQYALYRALEYRGRTVKASLGFYNKHPEYLRSFSLIDVFPQITLDCISDEEFSEIDSNWKKIKMDKEALDIFLSDYKNRFFWVEERDFIFYPEIFETRNCTFVGYWQSEKYFNCIRKVLLQDFMFSYGEKNLSNLRSMFLQGEQYVSVHIRRGDYLEHPEVWGIISESRYYEKAIAFIQKLMPRSQLVFFSDEIQWVKERYIYKDAIYIEENMFDQYKPWYDMSLMSCCAHNIIANSSFSWWGAWLNNNTKKIVLAPEKWFYDGRSGKDICPDTWLKITI